MIFFSFLLISFYLHSKINSHIENSLFFIFTIAETNVCFFQERLENAMERPYIFNIQKFSIHDGDGIRTTIFFKGCPLTCLWCHNPESQRFPLELMFYHERCTGCGACIPPCPKHANSIENGRLVIDRRLCTSCGICTKACISNAREVVGKIYSIAELVKEVKKDQMFYEESGGGVTLSGGEVMVQNMDYIEELCRKLHKEGFHVAIDTCGYAAYENFQRILPFVDTFLYDIKAMDNEQHMKYVGTSNQLILENLVKLSQDHAVINIRLPIIAGVNDDEAFINATVDFLKKNDIQIKQINLLPYHNIGKGKYKNLDRFYEEEQMKVPSSDKMEGFQHILISHGFNNTKIGG